MTTYDTLREANIARHAEWTNNQLVELTWRGTELAGEIGEVIDLILTLGEPGGNFSQYIQDECADSWICLDLTAMTLGFDPFPYNSLALTGRSGSWDNTGARLGALTGRVCNQLKKLEREKRGWPGSKGSMQALNLDMVYLAATINRVAIDCDFMLSDAVQRKFNATSQKVGLQTRLGTDTTERDLPGEDSRDNYYDKDH
jgi:hypothetical protein